MSRGSFKKLITLPHYDTGSAESRRLYSIFPVHDPTIILLWGERWGKPKKQGCAVLYACLLQGKTSDPHPWEFRSQATLFLPTGFHVMTRTMSSSTHSTLLLTEFVRKGSQTEVRLRLLLAYLYFSLSHTYCTIHTFLVCRAAKASDPFFA